MSFYDFVIENEATIRLSFFLGVLVIMAIWEIIAPKRALTVSKVLRWSNNIGLVVINTLLLRFIFPTAAVGVAVMANEQNWGVLNVYSIPSELSVLISIITLDLVIYLQHIMVHAVPLLWRIHRVHHADLDYDVTTGSRFHPLEIIFSLWVKFAAIVLLGAPIIAVIIFEILLNVMAMFNHANISLPAPVDKLLRKVIVTPDMHRVHHSIEDDEANSNFGFNLSVWDRLFGTYRKQPRAGHENMLIGIRNFRELHQVTWISGLLAMPFIGKISDYAINRRDWKE